AGGWRRDRRLALSPFRRARNAGAAVSHGAYISRGGKKLERKRRQFVVHARRHAGRRRGQIAGGSWEVSLTGNCAALEYLSPAVQLMDSPRIDRRRRDDRIGDLWAHGPPLERHECLSNGRKFPGLFGKLVSPYGKGRNGRITKSESEAAK